MSIFETPYDRNPDVLWHAVGVDAEETLLIKEGAETRMFIVSGATGAAIWSRLDGARTAGDIAEEMAAARQITIEAARALVAGFLNGLEENELVAKADLYRTSTPAVPAEFTDWPKNIAPPALAPLELESLVADGMVALASFAGGKENVGGSGSCSPSLGGKNNVTGHEPVCHS